MTGLSRATTGVVHLTAAGAAEFEDLRTYVAGPSVALLGQFDVHDIETTVRTLQAITRTGGRGSVNPSRSSLRPGG